MNISHSDPQIINYLSKLAPGLCIECDPANYIDNFILANGIWEPLVVTALKVLIQPGSICVDAGANAGYLSLVMGRFAGPAGRVISFKPNRELITKFIRNMSLNPDLERTIELHTTGLGKETSKMFVSPDQG
jgi:hypothetical protein